jgi:serine/threonine protein phosphatase PrpC
VCDCSPAGCSLRLVCVTCLQGLAMSRSFGDTAAETVGVFAQPELTEVYLSPNDLFVIFATDGVWELISSQEAVKIVALYLSTTPAEACAALVKEATK